MGRYEVIVEKVVWEQFSVEADSSEEACDEVIAGGGEFEGEVNPEFGEGLVVSVTEND